MDTVDVGIVIPVLNNASVTKDCLERVLATKGDLSVDIVVVDNASTDETPEMLTAFGASVRTIRNQENAGFTIASNQGAREARGRYLVFLNNDTLPERDWLAWLVKTAEDDASVGAVGAKLVYPDGTLQEAGGIIFSDGNGFNYGRGADPDHPRYRYVREVDYCSAAALLVRRDVFEQLGGFDERYAPAYYEDTDLCFGVRSLGFKVLYQPRSVVVHLEGRTAGTDVGRGLKRYQEINRPKFVEKWKDALSVQHRYAGDVVETACYRGATRSVFLAHPTLPMYDISSGDLRFHKLVTILRSLGARVVLCAAQSTARERLRYVPELEQAGVEVYASDPAFAPPPAGEAPDRYPLQFPPLLAARDFDAAILSHFGAVMRYTDEIRLVSPRTEVIADTCDLHYLRELRQAELEGDQAHRERALAMRRMELAAYLRSDVVLTVTEDDRKCLLSQLPTLDVRVVPNIHAVEHDSPAFGEREGIVFVGYFEHSPNQDAMRFFVDEVFPLVRAKLPGAKLMIVGSKPTPEILAMATDDIEVTGYVPETKPYLDACRVSIAPLRYGAGMKGKIGEAMQAGIPVVTTTIGAEGIGLEDGVNALIADGPQEFADAVARLYTDRGLWESIAEKAKQQIDDNYSTRIVTEKVASLLELGREQGGAGQA